MIKNLVGILSVFLVVSCSGGTGISTGRGGASIWNDNSQRLQITVDMGNVVGGDRFETKDRSRDTLSDETIGLLEMMRATSSGGGCVNDGVTYELIITDGSGLDNIYYSDNRDCNREADGSGFVVTSEAKEVFDSIE